MTDSHCHFFGETSYAKVACTARPADFPQAVSSSSVNVFIGVHPWYAEEFDDTVAGEMEEILERNPSFGVGEIGLDRLKTKVTTPVQNSVFRTQLEIAAAKERAISLHGAKCWGEVVKSVKPFASRIPAMLFHGFSRSEGLLPEIASMGGFISVGAAVLNDHAVNYREMVKRLPLEMTLVESDAFDLSVDVSAVGAKIAELKGIDVGEFNGIVDANFRRFLGCGSSGVAQ